MKKLVTTFCAVAALALVAQSAFAANAVRISQVYGGGGGSTGTYLYDYVELFNSSASPANIGGWAIEYGSATGNWGSATTNYYVFPAGTTIQPCSYLLIQCGAVGSVGTALPVTPDIVTGNMSASATSGKFGLFNALQSSVVCGSEAAGSLVDKVAYGTANCWEGAGGAPALTSSTVAVRLNGGLTDTDSNVADFGSVSAVGITLHNAASGQSAACLTTPSMNSTWGRVKSIYR
jgi:uncharacterized protein